MLDPVVVELAEDELEPDPEPAGAPRLLLYQGVTAWGRSVVVAFAAAFLNAAALPVLF